MNEVFLIGKVIEDVDYKFMLEKKKNAKVVIKLELLDKTKVEVIGYNDLADYALRNIKIGGNIFLNGTIIDNDIIIKEIEI